MGDIFIVGLFFGAIFLVITFVLMYQWLRYLKGGVKILLPSHEANYGDRIKFDVEINAKKHLEVQKIELELKSYRKERYYSKGKTQTREVELYKEIYALSEQDNILAGTKKTLPAEVMIPSYEALPEEMKLMIEHSQKSRNFQRFYRNKKYLNGDIKWQVKVLVHCSGIDIYKRESLHLKNPIASGNV